jgi:ATP-dependent DNA helicase RecQ
MTLSPPPDITTALHHYFGFPAFRERQEEVVQRAVEGRDTLALMPTGAGKSLCYQLAAMLRPTPTLVISPLIALMKDQVDNLPDEVRRQATLINSSLDRVEANRRLQGLARGEFRLLYAAPERLRQRQFIAALRSVGIGMVVIDEVHCVSMWGHDFRPDYLFIRAALEALHNPTVLGLTATAAPVTVADIQRGLGRQMDVIKTTVERPNLRYEVDHVDNEEERLRVTMAHVKKLPESGIIYARSREKCETVTRLLQRQGVRAAYYHAGLETAERARVQDSFLDGSVRVIVATTAFGMGIDKPDIRWVLLYNYPDSLETYVQMVGRAGRDGQVSTCILLAGSADAANVRRFARADIPSIDRLRAVYRILREQAEEGWTEISADTLTRVVGLGENEDPRVLAGMLEQAGLVRRDHDAGRAMRFELVPPPPDTAARITSLLERYEREARDRAERIISFADAHRCRHLQVAEHFGETVEIPCGMCDVCAPPKYADTGRSREQRPLPRNLTEVILDTVHDLQHPLGLSGLVNTLRGSVEAPPTGQRDSHYGALGSASKGSIQGWITQLIDSGHLEYYENEGFRLLRPGPQRGRPPTTVSHSKVTNALRGSAHETPRKKNTVPPPNTRLTRELEAWRQDKARRAGLSTAMILPDGALASIAHARPTTRSALALCASLGADRMERYGEEILAMVKATE